MEFCKHHNYINPPPIRKPIPNADLYSFVPDKFDVDFILQIPFEQLFDLVKIWEDLKIISLVDLTYARIATEFKGNLPG